MPGFVGASPLAITGFVGASLLAIGMARGLCRPSLAGKLPQNRKTGYPFVNQPAGHDGLCRRQPTGHAGLCRRQPAGDWNGSWSVQTIACRQAAAKIMADKLL